MKTITGKPIILENRSSFYAESMSDIVPWTKEYFTSWHSHDRFGRSGEDYIVSNAIYTYPNGCLEIKILGKIYIAVNATLPDMFLDLTKCNVHKTSIGNYHNAIEINVNGKLAGYYLSDINTLVLSDWTHSSDCIKVFAKIWPALINQLKLKKLNITQDKYAIKEVLVGCDPEFELVDGNTILNAGCDIDEEEIDCDGQIGLDGSGDQIEIRPDPGTPIKVTQNIRKLIKNFADLYEYDLSDEGHEYPLGGHIHVGIGRNWHPDRKLIELLDDFIGRPTIELSGEARSEYKNLSEVRSQPHGFEYRSAPAAIFHDPAIACICMKLARNLTIRYLNEEVLQYNEVPNIDDYISVGGLSKQQSIYFMKFCKSYKPTKSIIASWRLSKKEKKKVVENNLVELIFQDTWDERCKAYITRHVIKELREIVTSPIIIKLYGLGESKGRNLCTIPTGGCTGEYEGQLTKPLWNPETRLLNIGLSYDRRTTSGFSETFEYMLARNIRYIIINNKYGRI